MLGQNASNFSGIITQIFSKGGLIDENFVRA